MSRKGRRQKIKEIVITIIFMLPHLLLWLYVIKEMVIPLSYTSTLLLFGTEYTGIVIHQEKSLCGGWGRHRNSECSLPYVSYTDSEGNEIIINDKYNLKLGSDLYPIGKETGVVVHPIFEKKGIVNNYNEVMDDFILSLIFTLSFTFIYVYVYYLVKKKHGKVYPLAYSGAFRRFRHKT